MLVTMTTAPRGGSVASNGTTRPTLQHDKEVERKVKRVTDSIISELITSNIYANRPNLGTLDGTIYD